MEVQERERWQRLMAIYNKTEARSTGTLKSGKKFKKSDLLANRKLRHEGELYWKNARAKLTEVHGVLLTDVLLLLTENNGKFTFASQDNKSSIIPLFKLIVRDVAIDPKSVYLISQNKAGPEMYEVMCTSEHTRREWKKRLLEAIEQCPPDDPLDTGIDNNNEEERKKAEEKALKIKKLLELMHAKDRELNSVISDKMRLVGELKELIVEEDSVGTLKMPIICQHEIQMDQTRDIILAAMKEADLPTRSIYSGGNVRVSLSASSVGEPNLPEGPIPAEAIEKMSENPVALEHVNAATQIHEHLNSLLKITVNQDTAFQTLKNQLLEAQNKIESISTSPTTTTSPSPKEKRRDSPPLIRMDPAGQDSRGSVNRGGVNITNDRVTEVAATEKAKANGEKPGKIFTIGIISEDKQCSDETFREQSPGQ